MLEHGGNLKRASAEFGIPLERWLDLSTGINPNGYPVAPPAPELWRRLPQDDETLLAAASAYYGCKRTALMPVSGSQAAIQALPRLRRRSRVLLAEPTYNEHAAAWTRQGHEVKTVAAADLGQAHEDADVVVACNPNNPTCDRFSRPALLKCHAALARRGGWLIVDEAFGDASPECSLAGKAGTPGLVVLRSLGKFFGLAGARVGFVLGEVKLLHALGDELGPWTVSGPAQHAAQQALADRAWQDRTRTSLAAASDRLGRLLKQHGIEGPGTALFRWWPTPRAADFHRTMARRGILVRRFAAGVRIGLPGREDEWRRLAEALDQWE